MDVLSDMSAKKSRFFFTPSLRALKNNFFLVSAEIKLLRIRRKDAKKIMKIENIAKRLYLNN